MQQYAEISHFVCATISPEVEIQDTFSERGWELLQEDRDCRKSMARLKHE